MMPVDGYSSAEIERIMAELSRKIDDLKTDLRSDYADLKNDLAAMKQQVVYVDVHKVVTDSLRAEIARANDKATTAEQIAKWALATLVALLGVVITIAVLIATSNGVV